MCFGTIMSIGGIVAAAVYSSGLPFLVALGAGGAAGACAGGLIYIGCSRLIGFLFAVATLSFGELARVIALNTERFGGALGYKDVRASPSICYPFALMGIAIICLGIFDKCPMRLALRIIKEDEVNAASLGINIGLHRLAAVVSGSFVVALAGGLYIHAVGLLEPRMFGFDNSLEILIFAIVGGTATYVGPICGAVLLTALPELLRFSTSLRMLFYGAVLVVIIIFRPEGIIGSRFGQSRGQTVIR
jgi:branched-chain amino acid transport system permease protein